MVAFNGMKNFTSNSQKIGEIGENVACTFLMKQGFTVLERNYTKKWGEIDIIAEKTGKLYFIEVKARSVPFLSEKLAGNYAEGVARPEDNMHPMKMKRLSRVIQTYLMSKQKAGSREWQVDLYVVFLDLEHRTAKVKVIANIIL